MKQENRFITLANTVQNKFFPESVPTLFTVQNKYQKFIDLLESQCTERKC